MQKSVTVQCKARGNYESPSRQQKYQGEKNFSALRPERSSLHTSIHCLRQWPYHSKIPRASTVQWLLLLCFMMIIHSNSQDGTDMVCVSCMKWLCGAQNKVCYTMFYKLPWSMVHISMDNTWGVIPC